jgi:hypothetical protein
MQIRIMLTSNNKNNQSNKGIAQKIKQNPAHLFHMEKMGGVKLKNNLGMANNVQ